MNFLDAIEECRKGKVMRLKNTHELIRMIEEILYVSSFDRDFIPEHGAIPADWLIGRWYERNEVV